LEGRLVACYLLLVTGHLHLDAWKEKESQMRIGNSEMVVLEDAAVLSYKAAEIFVSLYI